MHLAVGHTVVIDVLLREHFADAVKHHVHILGYFDRDSVHSSADSLDRSLDILKDKIECVCILSSYSENVCT